MENITANSELLAPFNSLVQACRLPPVSQILDIVQAKYEHEDVINKIAQSNNKQNLIATVSILNI